MSSVNNLGTGMHSVHNPVEIVQLMFIIIFCWLKKNHPWLSKDSDQTHNTYHISDFVSSSFTLPRSPESHVCWSKTNCSLGLTQRSWSVDKRASLWHSHCKFKCLLGFKLTSMPLRDKTVVLSLSWLLILYLRDLSLCEGSFIFYLSLRR